MRISPHSDQDRKRNRLKGYDYSNDGFYSVTICTRDREHLFGKICNDKMVLNKLGKIAEKCWREIPDHFTDVKLDEFVVMPNHIHGIVWIDYWNDGENTKSVGNADLRSLTKAKPDDRTKMLLSKIIHGFKSSVTRIIRHQNLNTNFVWQKSFHDRIIRNENELNNIREYIWLNPERWKKDRNNVMTKEYFR